MSAPTFYIVADGNAYALDDDNVAFGAPVKLDGTVDWDCAYDFDPWVNSRSPGSGAIR